jgi:GNAT superfamily N-acetyltransferase
MAGARKFVTQKPEGAPELRLRPAQHGDYGFALALYLDGVRQHLLALGRWDEAAVVARFERSFNPAQAQVVCLGAEEIGWMQVSESAERFHIHQIHLLAPFRGRGIGARLIRELLERAVGLGKPVALNVIIGNPARWLYERLGFRVTGGDQEIVHMLWEAGGAEGEGVRVG